MRFRLEKWWLGFVVVYAVALHAWFIYVLPDPIFQPDSLGYITPALEWLSGRGFHVPPIRSFGYPLWVAFWLKVGGGFTALLIAQHILALATAWLCALIAVRFFAVPRWGGGLCFLLVASLPKLLVYSHNALTESLFTFCLAVNVYALAVALKQGGVKPWILVSIATWISLLIRPVGKAFLVALTAAGASVVRQSSHRRGIAIGGILLAFTYLLSCGVNYATRGFWGLERFSGISLIGSTARYLNSDSMDPNWVRYNENGLVARLSKTHSDPAELNQTLLSLSWTAIRQQPWPFVRDQLKAFAQFLWSRSARPTHLLAKEETAARGLAMYVAAVQTTPQAASWVVFDPQTASSYFERIAHQRLFPYESSPGTWILWPWVSASRWAAIAALLMTPFLLAIPATRRLTGLLWITMASHIFLSNLGADFDGRHALSVEPLYVVLCVAGIAAIYSRGMSRSAKTFLLALSISFLLEGASFAEDPAVKPKIIPPWATFQRSVDLELIGQRVDDGSRLVNQSIRLRSRYLDPSARAFAGMVGGFHHFNRDIQLDEPPTRDEMEWVGNMGVEIGLVRGKHLWWFDLMGAAAGTTLGPALALGGDHKLGFGFLLYHRSEANFFYGATKDILFDLDQGMCWGSDAVSLCGGYRVVSSWQMNRNGPRVGVRMRFSSPKIPFIFPSLG